MLKHEKLNEILAEVKQKKSAVEWRLNHDSVNTTENGHLGSLQMLKKDGIKQC